MRALLVFILSFAMIGAAVAQVWIMAPNGGGGAFGTHGGSPPVTNFLLLANGTSYLLLTDGTSRLCLAGGC